MSYYQVFIGALLFVLLSACSNNSEQESLDLNFELQIIDSIQVDLMESVMAMDFKGDRGVVYTYQSNQITLFDSDGKTIRSKSYPKEGPGSIRFLTNMRFLDNGNILLYPLGNTLILLDEDLEVIKNLEMPFPPELQGAAYFQYMFAVHGDEAFIYYPGRDGGNPYLPNYYKDHKILERLNLNTGISQPTYKLPENSKYQSDLTYSYPTVTLSARNEKIYVALDAESLIHVYDAKSDAPALKTLDFKPRKFVQMPGEKAESVSFYGKIYPGRIKNIFAIPEGVVVHYNEGVEEEVYQRESLVEKENWDKLPDYNMIKLKVYLEEKGWSNEIQVPAHIHAIHGIHDVENSFYGFRNDDHIGEEQDFRTFYKLKLIRKKVIRS